MKFLYKLTGYRTRYIYWSCTDFSHWLEKIIGMIPKPTSATSEGWTEWSTANQKSHPILYWIIEEGFDIVQNIIYFPYDVYRNISAKLHNIFIHKTHYINTKLSRGQWYDCDTRILHGLCELVVEFVEGEKAHMNDVSNVNKKKYKDRRVAGLAYLDWEIGLNEDSPTQAKTAKEIKKIYLWWKDVYPNRPDPHDVSGWTEYCDNKKGPAWEHTEEKDKKRVRKILKLCNKIERQYYNEETKMLQCIIGVREGMWT